MNKSIILICIVTLGVVGCKKYEEGPMVSLMPRKERISNLWKIDNATTQDGKDTTNGFRNWIIELTRDGSIIKTVSTPLGLLKTNGYWQLNNSASDLDLFYDDGTKTSNVILKLKHKELWYRDKTSLITFKLSQR